MARTPMLQPQEGFKYATIFGFSIVSNLLQLKEAFPTKNTPFDIEKFASSCNSVNAGGDNLFIATRKRLTVKQR